MQWIFGNSQCFRGQDFQLSASLSGETKDVGTAEEVRRTGTGAFLDEGGFTTVSFPETAVPRGAKFGIRVSGDSMEPVYHDGQIVWVKPCETLLPGQVGVFLYDGEGFLKVYGQQPPADAEVFPDSDEAAQMQPVLISYNKAYPPRPVLPERGFRVVGRVL